MSALHSARRFAASLAALVVGATLAGEGPAIAAPDPALLEFLGELSGEEPLFLEFTTTREAKRAAKAAEGAEAAPEPAPGQATDPQSEVALPWEALDAPVQSLLAPDAAQWAALPPERQRAKADGARRWLELDGIGRAQANDRWQTWRSLSSDQQERLREAWARFRKLAPGQQQALRAAFLQYGDQPGEQRDRLLERLQQMSPEERRRTMNRRQGPKPGTEDKRPCPPC